MSQEDSRGELTDGYWQHSRQPLTSLAFILPFLLVYEVGMIVGGSSAIRNGADVWLRAFLGYLGFGQFLLLPLLCIGILLGWHHTSQQPWRVRPLVLPVMFFESLGLAVCLLVAASLRFQPASAALSFSEQTLQGIGYFGAGIYEELLFRLMLLPLLMFVTRRWLSHEASVFVVAAIVSSLLFSMVHYRLDIPLGFARIHLEHGYDFTWFSFCFRFLAGVLFCLLFRFRGFGIAVGVHACYDVLTLIV